MHVFSIRQRQKSWCGILPGEANVYIMHHTECVVCIQEDLRWIERATRSYSDPVEVILESLRGLQL